MVSLIIKRLVQILVQSVIVPALVLFLAAGRLDWVGAWVYLGLFLVNLGFNTLVMMSGHRELIEERAQMKGVVKAWDMVILSITGVAILVMMAVAGLGSRFG